jgi:hypothetical protein
MTSVQERVITRKRQILEKRLEELFQELEAVMQQMGQTLSEVEKNRLERQKESIDQQIDKTADELSALEHKFQGTAIEDTDFNKTYLDLESKLLEIDFRELEETIRLILRDHRDDGCAAMLLFQRSARMGGEWCAARIRELLRRETIDGRFRHIPLEFQPSEHADGKVLLRRLGQNLGIEPGSRDLQDFSQLVVQKLCGSLQGGSVIMIDCRRCDYLSREPGIFNWLLKEFWRDIVRGLSAVGKKYYEVKVILLLFIDDTLPEGCITADQCCTFGNFKKDKLLEICLTEWTRGDIKKWIARYSGLSLGRAQVDTMADKVYRSTDGLPSLVAHELLKECTPATAG